MVPADSRRIPRDPRYSGFRAAHDTTRVRGCHPLRRSFPEASPSVSHADCAVLQPRRGVATAAVWALPRSLATTKGITILFSLPRGTKMFQFPRFASVHVVRIAVLQTAGLSHSEIPGSWVICTYPELIAAYHVLHRLREPRHPPFALLYFRQFTKTQQLCIMHY